MRFENWIEKNIKESSYESYGLFQEAILCYRIKAFNASFLFSYLGFFKYLKAYLNNSKKPSEIPERRWNQILKNIEKEDSWEKDIYTEIVNAKNPIFNISDELRMQIKFFKVCRNDCAHAKTKSINHTHTDLFWSFFMTNINKITLEGGLQNLVNKLKEQFDRDKHSKFEKYDNLITEIGNTIEPKHYNRFITILTENLEEKYIFIDDIIFEIFDKIFEKYETETSLIKTVKNYLNKNNLDLSFLSNYPNRFKAYNYNKSGLRQIWRGRAKELSNSKKYIILALVLMESSFTGSELKELTEEYIKSFDQTGFNNLPIHSEFRKIISNEYFMNFIREKYFSNKKLYEFDTHAINKTSDLIALYIEKSQLNKEDLIQLSALKDHKGFFPNWLSQSLKESLQANEVFKNDFERKCNDYNIKNLNFLIG